jgi:hypothetical protein
MEENYHLEVHYYQQHQAAVIIQGDITKKDGYLGELILFNCFALRQMSNLKQIGTAVANVLTCVNAYPDSFTSYMELIQHFRTVQELVVHVPLLGALGLDLAYVVRYSLVPEIVMARAATGHDIKEIANDTWPDTVKLVEKRISDGKYQFICDLRIGNNKAFFELAPKGFGILGKAVNWYASTSVMMVFLFLLNLHSESSFKDALAKCANKCGEAYINGKVNALSLLNLPVDIAQEAAT